MQRTGLGIENGTGRCNRPKEGTSRNALIFLNPDPKTCAHDTVSTYPNNEKNKPTSSGLPGKENIETDGWII